MSQPSNAPGTTAGRRPLPGMDESPSARNASMVAAAGAGPWPQSTRTPSSLAAWKIAGSSPPGPFRCGSATCSTKPAATAASKALPPFSSTAMPTAEASQWVLVTTP